MNALRIEADEATAKVEELSADKKRLEQENLAKEQEITSLTHKNQLLESEVEKLETSLKDVKAMADESTQAGTHNESLTRRVQLLEEEAEEADKNLRETNEKYVSFITPNRFWFPCVRVADVVIVPLQIPLHYVSRTILTSSQQAPPNRRAGRPLRAQGAGSRGREGPVGVQVRGDGQEVCRHQEGAGRLRQRDWQHLILSSLASALSFTTQTISSSPRASFNGWHNVLRIELWADAGGALVTQASRHCISLLVIPSK